MKNKLKNEMLKKVEEDVEKALNSKVEGDKEMYALSFINDDQRADDVLFWYNSAMNQIKELEDFKDKEIERVESFCENKIQKIKKRLSFYSSSLESYLLCFGKRSETLSNGKFGMRKSPNKVIIKDRGIFIEYCKKNKLLNLYCETSYKPIALKLRKHIERTGELPTGVSYVTGEPKFYVKPAEEE